MESKASNNFAIHSATSEVYSKSLLQECTSDTRSMWWEQECVDVRTGFRDTGYPGFFFSRGLSGIY